MKSAIAFALLLSASTGAYAGPSSSGGGPSIICNGPEGKVQTAQMLDLYEGQIRYGLAIPTLPTPGAAQLQAAFDRLTAYDWFVASDVQAALVDISSKVAFLPDGVIMAPGVDLGDSYAAVVPDGCELAYAGYYEADGTLRISRTIFDKLDETDKAALFLHEAIYKVARELGEDTDSLATREINAYLFSAAPDLSALDSIKSHVTWVGHMGPQLYSLHPPTQVQGIQPITVNFSDPNPGNAGFLLTITCLNRSSTEQISLASNEAATFTQSYALPPDCEFLEVFVGFSAVAPGPSADTNVTLLYGSQTLDVGTAEMDVGSWEDALPIYHSQPLTLPQLPF